MNFFISVRSLFALIAYSICFMVSYFLFWDDQFRLSNFHIDPFQSIVTRILVKNSAWNMQDEARLLGVILAFASTHLSWHFRYLVGDKLMDVYVKHRQKSKPVKVVDVVDMGEQVGIGHDTKPTSSDDTTK